MRIAFLDLLFAWPPHGGACTDVYHTVQELERAGHKPRLFSVAVPGMGERAGAEGMDLPFPHTEIVVNRAAFTIETLASRIRYALDAWSPDAVILGDAFFIKPYLMEALNDWPLGARYYAYEVNCPRDFRRFLHGRRCPKDYLTTPDTCRSCALQGVGPELRSGIHGAWTQEYLMARAWEPDYHARLRHALQRLRAIIVYNDIQKSLIEPVNARVHVVPGGVDAGAFAVTPLPERAVGEKMVVAMPGRCEDTAKGMAVLREAGAKLATDRADFVIRATHPDTGLNTDWFEAVGWKDRDGVAAMLADAEVAVVPSLWEEPFGMVAVEAMAVGRPVVAARGGGLSHIVAHEETGFLYEARDAGQLAERLAQLLDDADLRRRMGHAARARVEQEYDWPRIIERCYPPILEALGA